MLYFIMAGCHMSYGVVSTAGGHNIVLLKIMNASCIMENTLHVFDLMPFSFCCFPHLYVNVCMYACVCVCIHIMSLVVYRQEFMILERAHMAVEYEQREGARRKQEWDDRGVISTDLLPKPDMTLMSPEHAFS
jgi:hypothetical protein